MRSIWRGVVSVLLVVEGLTGALRLAGLLPTLQVYGPLTVGLLLIRGLISALQCTGGWWLAGGRPTAAPIIRAAMIASAVLTVLETGLRLTPSNLDPTFRWWVVAAYGVYAFSIVRGVRSCESVFGVRS